MAKTDGDNYYPTDAPYLLRWCLPDDFTDTAAFAIFYYGAPLN